MNFDEWWEIFQLESPRIASRKEIALAAWMGAVTLDDDYLLSSECYITLLTCGDNRISAIKIIREFTNLGLKESKNIVETLPINLRGYRKPTLGRLVTAWNTLPGARATFHEGVCYRGDCESCGERFSCFTGS